MKSTNFLREPGYIYDLIFIFIYHFNRDYFLDNCVNYDKSESDIEFFKSSMYEFSDIPDELMLFFNVRENGRCFFTTHYYEPYKNLFTSDYNLTFVQRLFIDVKAVTKNMLKYYFPDIEESKVDVCLNSIIELSKLIVTSDYDYKIKSWLHAFFVDPLPIVDKLNHSLLSANSLLLKYYEKNIQTIIDTQNQINVDSLIEDFSKMDAHKLTVDKFEQLYVSICLLTKNCMRAFLLDDSAVVLLGYDYKDAISFLKSKQMAIKLDEISNILSEKNRIKILEILSEKGDTPIRDIENELNISGANAYYHITMMLKAHMIKSRNEGKTMLYSLDRNHFDAIRALLKKFSTEKGE